jgi:transcriptional regulator with PAS, ATPase and Fis domain
MARDLTDRKLSGTEFTSFLPGRYISPAMREALVHTELAANSESVVLFLGESGSGKDYLARYLHQTSNRANGPFIVINCAALPEQLMESELFGHDPGAFTGSSGRKHGLVELAESGTFLLNEVGELPWRIQAKLLDFLDNQSFMRVGGEKQLCVNSRVIAASNRDLEMEVRAGNFRADLYYRLNVFSVHVPPLRLRLEDLPILVKELLGFLSRKMGHIKIPTVDRNTMVVLAQYNWPGNVRELRNVMERALILCGQSDQIKIEHLGLTYQPGSDPGGQRDIPPPVELTDDLSFPERIYQIKKTLIEEALVRSGEGIKKTAAILGITRDSLIHHMKSLGIHR